VCIVPSASALPRCKLWRISRKGCDGLHRIVVAEGNDAPGLTYITPYAATSIAEYFMEKGRDVLIVYEQSDAARRSLSRVVPAAATSARPQAFPAIFSIFIRECWNARRTEQGRRWRIAHRAANHRPKRRTFPPTFDQPNFHHRRSNLLSPSLFNWCAARGRCRQIRFGASAERRNGRLTARSRATSSSPTRSLRNLRLARFGARLDDDTRKIIEHGRRIRACLKQPEFARCPCRPKSPSCWH